MRIVPVGRLCEEGNLPLGDYARKEAGLAAIPENDFHSSAAYYYTGNQGKYPVITYMEIQDIDPDMR
jgi:hypothetical protein